MTREHTYRLTIIWTGNTGSGTENYRSYERSHSVVTDHKKAIDCSSDPAFRGDATKHNPEELLVASISSCHMLWFLHLCSEAGVTVTDYTDHATGTMTEAANGSGQFKEVILNPVVTVTDTHMIDKANALHKKANELCFIANSLNFKVKHQPLCKTG